MNIRIVDSHLREFLITQATPETIAEKLSLTSVSVEKIEKVNNELIYEIEVTSNRPDLMSVIGIAKEAAAILPRFGIQAHFHPHPVKKTNEEGKPKLPLEIIIDPKLVNRVCAVLMEVEVGESSKKIKDRLEAMDIRSLNNLIDITNYVMRETGHPTHVFDFDRLNTKKLIIRESKKGEIIKTLDEKTHILPGGDIVADNGNGEIVDLLAIMGTKNSVVTEKTKRILFFIDNNNPHRIRKTSMSLGIRSEAAIINEKGIDPETATLALYRGIELYHELAKGKLAAQITDLYPNKPTVKTVKVEKSKIDTVIGVKLDLKECAEILKDLGFKIETKETFLEVTVPTSRLNDVTVPEDVIEEIARVYGYFRLPSELPPVTKVESYHIEKNQFYWEQRTKEALKYWGFNEVYTYSFISEEMLETSPQDSLQLANPLSEEMLYMRTSLTPSLLAVIKENKARQDIKIFEIAKIYLKREGQLPEEKVMLAGIIKKTQANFFEAKGITEQLFEDLGIKKYRFKPTEKGGLGASIFLENDYVGELEVLNEQIIDFELDFELIIKMASLSKTYSPIAKFPPIIEDLSFKTIEGITTEQIIEEIYKTSPLVREVSFLDHYKDTKTLHILYQDPEKNLTNEEVSELRNKIIKNLAQNLQITYKG